MVPRKHKQTQTRFTTRCIYSINPEPILNMKQLMQRSLSVAFFLAVALLIPTGVQAQWFTWIGTNSDPALAGNWSATVPTFGATNASGLLMAGGHSTLIYSNAQGTTTIGTSSGASFAGLSWIGYSSGTATVQVFGGILNLNGAFSNDSGLESVWLGNGGPTGNMTVNGGTVSVLNGMVIGRNNSSGTLSIASGSFTAGRFSTAYGTLVGGASGQTGTGTITIGNGGQFILSGAATNPFVFHGSLIASAANTSSSYVNFTAGASGSITLNLTNATLGAAYYTNLIANGYVEINGVVVSNIANYVINTSNLSAATLSLPPVTVSGASIAPTNIVYAGTPVTLSALASGASSYQWQTDNGSSGASFSNIGGATSTNYVLNTTALLGTYQYQIIASAGALSVTSAPASLTVVAASAPILVTNSASPNVTTNYVGNTETYSASFTGTLPISYQWQVSPNANGSAATVLTSQTNTTLVLTNLQLTNSGYYSLQASNNVSPFTTNSAWTQLVVVPVTNAFIVWSAPVPFLGQTAGQILTNPAGAYLEAEYFGSSTAPVTVTVNGNIFLFKGDGSSASVAGSIGTTSGAWLPNTTGDTNFDSVLNQFAYDGGIHTITLHNLVIGQQYAIQLFALDNRPYAVITNRLTTFQATNDAADISAAYTMGTNAYLIGTFTAPSTDVAIQQNVPAGGNINALVVRALSYLPAVQASILTSPTSVTVYQGRTVQFSATADGVPTPTLNWQAGPVGGPYTNLVNGGQFSGVTSGTLTVSNVTLAESGTEFVLFATNSAGSAISSAADLTVLAAPALSGVNSTNILAANPVAYWPFNETANPDATPNVSTLPVYDASVNQHDGLYLYLCYNAYDGIVGPQLSDGYPQFTAGQGAMSPLTNTANTWATVPALNLNTNTVTMLMWVYPDGPQANYTGLLVNYTPGTASGMIYTSNQRLGYSWNNGNSGTYGYTGGPVIPTNMWSMVAMVVTPTNASFYVINTNGVSSTTYVYNNTNMSWNGTASIGAGANISSTFNGVMDEVAVFNYAMTSNQLVNLSSGIASASSTATALASSQNPSVYQQGVSFTASVTPAAATGTVQFLTNGVLFDTETLSSGSATSVAMAALPIGTNTIAANYVATGSYLNSSNTLSQVVAVNTNVATANFKATVSGAPGSQAMNFTWASDHQGWQLYTNSAGLTATGSWFPVLGSAAVTNESITINPAQPNVFFQLRYP